ncbi:alpha/beta hydrolase family protein [Kangiella shandongensis]|uniref:alpha/beta hydrolase family protein n=1 Tax=Kangiella shandongensis TaxID=2763258 RepID=UPI001CBD86C1|nr:prolyl oligopeptidase family serine peptidase [Kangiella shandongensis]
MILRTIILTAILALSSQTVNSKLIKANEIFSSSQFKNFVISPNGKALIGKSFLDGYHQLFALKSGEKEATEIFKLSNSNNMKIMDFNWLDNDTAYVSYIGSFNRMFTRFIDFEFKENSFDIDYFNIESFGFVVNPMPDIEDKALFSKIEKDDDKFELVKLDLKPLRSLRKHNKKAHKKVFNNFQVLSEDLDDTFEFYVSNDSYSLEMVGQYYDDYTAYSIFDESENEWREFFKVSKNKDDSTNHSKLDVFKPISKINAQYIVALSNLNRDKVAVVKFDTKQQKAVEVIYQSKSYDIKGANYNSKLNKLTSVTYVERGVNKQKFLDKAEQQLQAKLHDKIGLDSVFIIDRSTDSSNLVIFAYDASHPGKFYHYNEQRDKLRFLQNAKPDLHPYHFVKAKLLTAKSDLNKTIEGFLYLPENKSNNPLVVMPHGGPIGVQDLNEFDRGIQFLVNRGYAVLTMNFRGSSGYGRAYMSAGREQFGKGIEADINVLTQKALKLPQIDADNVCIYGSSYGGYSAVTSTILYPNTYKCAISAFGVFDLPLLYSASNLHHAQEIKDAIGFVVGDIDTEYKKLKDSSPLYRAEDIKVPTLLFAGTKDEVAYAEHSRRLNYVLNQLEAVDIEYYEYPRAKHGHLNWYGDIHQYLTIINFLNQIIGSDKSYSEEDKKVLAADNYTLGMLYYHGNFIEKDTTKAKNYLRLAHSYGDDRAAQYLRRLGVYNF